MARVRAIRAVSAIWLRINWSESNFRAAPNAEETSFTETLTLHRILFIDCGIYSLIQLFIVDNTVAILVEVSIPLVFQFFILFIDLCTIIDHVSP